MVTQPQTTSIPRLSWADHLDRWDWRQGQHITLIGPTGCGKTTLALQVLDLRGYPLVVSTKPRDPVVAELKADGYQVSRAWPPPSYRSVLWPPIDKPEDVDRQRAVIDQALREVYRTGGWTLYLDEARYVTEYLGLGKAVELLWLQGRSLGVSVIASGQRPRHMPLAAYSQATHLYVWRTRDRSDAQRLGEMSGGPPVLEVMAALDGLEGHEVLYMSATGEMWVTEVEVTGPIGTKPPVG